MIRNPGVLRPQFEVMVTLGTLIQMPLLDEDSLTTGITVSVTAMMSSDHRAVGPGELRLLNLWLFIRVDFDDCWDQWLDLDHGERWNLGSR